MKKASDSCLEPFTVAVNNIFYEELGWWLRLCLGYILLIYNSLPLQVFVGTGA